MKRYFFSKSEIFFPFFRSISLQQVAPYIAIELHYQWTPCIQMKVEVGWQMFKNSILSLKLLNPKDIKVQILTTIPSYLQMVTEIHIYISYLQIQLCTAQTGPNYVRDLTKSQVCNPMSQLKYSSSIDQFTYTFASITIIGSTLLLDPTYNGRLLRFRREKLN